ncbi:hypothetical protein ACCO45_008445 [Purpureocillium lilacinum]|uniref:Uncharacterized protein n=1 Tax=Purpureocillium lilacinum TaxID=33203 RepID=A0ACC4DP29_PURLI
MAARQMLPLARRLAAAAGPSTARARLLQPQTLPSVVLRPSTRRYAGSTSKQPSATSQFYKMFTRPIAKVLLLAVFTYQVVYWSWMRARGGRATIAELEATVGAYDKKKKEREEAGAEGKKTS